MLYEFLRTILFFIFELHNCIKKVLVFSHSNLRIIHLLDPPIQIPKPNISQKATHKVLYSTETVTLHCEVSIRVSELQYDWYKDSNILKTDHQSSINVTDGGNYECKAKHGSSESEKSDGYTITRQGEWIS